jgi:type II secretory pathway pseudopilin PulG
MENKGTSVFSLVELLTRITIVAILGSVIAPNFLTAKTRSDISRANADFRAIGIALGAYHLETNKYPWNTRAGAALAYGSATSTDGSSTPTLERLSTPIAYLDNSQSFLDPFHPDGEYVGAEQNEITNLPTRYDGRPIPYYWYISRNRNDESIWGDHTRVDIDPLWWFLESAGPSRKFVKSDRMLSIMDSDSDLNRGHCANIVYDPTNGTASFGCIWRFGGDPSGCYGSSLYYVAALNNR